jgi:flagellar basal-body rod protein FlgB
MINALFSDSNYVATKKMLDATVLRHEAIASNLANIETPNYKRLDVAPNFATDLKQALAGNDVDRMASMQPTIGVDATATAANRDGNSVELENELMQLNQNTLTHGLETHLISGALLKMRMAITGKSA